MFEKVGSPKQVFIIVVYIETDYQKLGPEFVTRRNKENAMEYILNLNYNEDKRRIDRVFSVNDQGSKITHYRPVLKDFKMDLEEVTV